jgi:ATP-dependent RNA helicase SUPV3L1/SUV3
MYTDLFRVGHVEDPYMAEQVRRADSTEGDIDTLSHRIAQIRTWTFVSNRPGWLADPSHWREKTREIEDRLSDALHERLTKRFVDRRTSVLMRRLRENTMLDAEISPTGTVLVEGHHVGELQGFRFTADQSAGGEDAKAVRTAAQKALATEFEARAERFAACPNGDIALGSDGTLRWIGAPIGTLVAGEDALKPRVILLADEQLTGPARDKVAARAERFVNFQIEQLLKPLVDLKNAEQLSGIARGIAFRLVENFGLVNRRDIADEMRSLDQEGRAALRRLGVRFGAYHVFVPALIKPAPAGLVTLLWALKNDGKDKLGFGDIVHALASGRTSMVVNQSFEKDFYRLAGYRNLGRRAVRVDILERLADLIRPATNWKPGLGPRPDGAYDGHAFMVTPPMMSILGATADDMEEILKGLGYRAEAKPAAEVKARLEAEDAATRAAAAAKEAEGEAARAEQAATTQEAVAEAADSQETPGGASTSAASDEAGSVLEDLPTENAADKPEGAVQPTATEQHLTAEGIAAEVLDASAWRDEASAGEAETANASAAQAESNAIAGPVSGMTGSGASVPQSSEETAEVEEQRPILLWRQARFDHRPRYRHDHRQRGARNAQAPGETTGQQGREGRRGKDGGEQFGHRLKGKPGQQGDGARPDKQDGRPYGNHSEQREARAGWKGGKGNGSRGPKPAFQAKPREERPARFDPDSPFAKLAALRDQLKK